jgi:hypothetical protein
MKGALGSICPVSVSTARVTSTISFTAGLPNPGMMDGAACSRGTSWVLLRTIGRALAGSGPELLEEARDVVAARQRL